MKKSFILYNDLVEIVSDLSNEQAGILLKNVLAFANENTPAEMDLPTKIVYKTVIMQIERDTEKHKITSAKRSKSGALGAAAKQDKANSGKDKQTPAKPSKPKQSKANVSNGKQNDDTDTDTVNETVTDTGITAPDVDFSKIPPIEVFLEEARIKWEGLYPASWCEKVATAFRAKYISWKDNGWKDGYNKPIKNWKSKISGQLTYIKASVGDLTVTPQKLPPLPKQFEKAPQQYADFYND